MNVKLWNKRRKQSVQHTPRLEAVDETLLVVLIVNAFSRKRVDQSAVDSILLVCRRKPVQSCSHGYSNLEYHLLAITPVLRVSQGFTLLMLHSSPLS